MVNQKDSILTGVLFNKGTTNATIPKILLSFYDKNKRLVWIDHLFIEESIRPRRKHYFSYRIPENVNIEVYSNDYSQSYSNGILNREIKNNFLPNRNEKQHEVLLQPIQSKKFSYVKMELNEYNGAFK
ncbi:hypothetical protein [Tenacibaculum sp. SG-28]|uniref:hypothetical protein n=1 Tax=Tenacibaculum sp. SG-28 TaxID=754426 RepID=UPI0026956AE0